MTVDHFKYFVQYSVSCGLSAATAPRGTNRHRTGTELAQNWHRTGTELAQNWHRTGTDRHQTDTDPLKVLKALCDN
jgi:hypothetical protein